MKGFIELSGEGGVEMGVMFILKVASHAEVSEKHPGALDEGRERAKLGEEFKIMESVRGGVDVGDGEEKTQEVERKPNVRECL